MLEIKFQNINLRSSCFVVVDQYLLTGIEIRGKISTS